MRRYKVVDDTALQPRTQVPAAQRSGSGCKCQLGGLASGERLLSGDFIQRGTELIEESVIDLHGRAASVGSRDEHTADG